MTGRTRARLLVVAATAAALLAAAVVVLLVTLGDTGRPTYRGSSPPGGIGLPPFVLPDQHGTILDSRSLRGNVVLVTFLDSQCSESCPIIAAVIGRALTLLTADQRTKVTALAISTDPAEDTPASVLAFLRRHRAENALHYLVAPESELRPIWRDFQIASSLDSGDDSLHSAPVRIYDTRSTWVATQHAGADLSAESLAHDIRLAVIA